MAACALLAAEPAAAQFPNFGGMIKGAQSFKKGADSLRVVPETEEVEIGGDLAATLLGAAPLVKSPDVQAYVGRVGGWLAQHSERPGLAWRFGVIDTPDVNAFSLPGGYILISRGLLDRMRNESELAGVLAHEIAHVVKKHQLQALQNSLRTQAVSELASQAGSMSGNRVLGTSAQIISAGKELFLRGLDKDDEYEADRMGAVIAARSGYTPYGLVSVLQMLGSAPASGGFALLTKTHPTPADRLDRLGAAMGERLDGLPHALDDTPGFQRLRNPPPPPPPAAAEPARKKPVARKPAARRR
jgi:predicted Zn-dependent protease